MLRFTMTMLTAVLILAPSPAPGQITDGSFEAVPAGALPGSAWSVSSGAVAVVEGFALPSHEYAFMPSQGTRYLRLTPGTTGPGAPGHGPHSGSDVGKVWQSFTVPDHEHIALSVDWEFIQLEPLIPTPYNDFFSIDVTAPGPIPTLVKNVVYVDTGTATTTDPYSNVPGAAGGEIAWVTNQTAFGTPSDHNPAPAGFKRAWVDLTGLVTPGQTLSLEISVGNGGDDTVDSIGLVDDVRLIVAQENQPGGRLRLLGSSHHDGWGVADDFGGDYLEGAPFEFRTMKGALLAFRASSTGTNVPWALFAGDLRPTGHYLPPVGTVNLDNLQVIIDGIDPAGVNHQLGTITAMKKYLQFLIGSNVTAGTTVAFQAVMIDAAAPSSIALSAATEVRVGGTTSGPGLILVVPVRSPLGNQQVTPANTGGANFSGGANSDDGATSVNLSSIGFSNGSWPLFGSSYSQIWVGSNGYLTFGGPDANGIQSEQSMLSSPLRRIAPLWNDFDYYNYGSVDFRVGWGTLTVAWEGVSTGNGPGTWMAAQLYDDGQFTFYYGSTGLQDGLVGISAGSLPVPSWPNVESLDWSSTSLSHGQRGSCTTHRFQQYLGSPAPTVVDELDIFTLGSPGPCRIHFVPKASGGYEFFTGTR